MEYKEFNQFLNSAKQTPYWEKFKTKTIIEVIGYLRVLKED